MNRTDNKYVWIPISGYLGPAYIIQGRMDGMVPAKYAKKYHEIYPGSELHMLPLGDHEFYRGGHEAISYVVDFF